MSRPISKQFAGAMNGNPTLAPGIVAANRASPRIAPCTNYIMPFHNDSQARTRTPAEQWAFALGWITIGVASGIGLVFATRSLRKSHDDSDLYGPPVPGEQAATIRAPLEAVEAMWLEWCASGRIRLNKNYAVRFEPAPGARGTEVHLVGGGSAASARDELRRFKRHIETGEIPQSMTSPAEVL